MQVRRVRCMGTPATLHVPRGIRYFGSLHTLRHTFTYAVPTLRPQGVYSNRPHCLVKFDLPMGNHRLTLALAQYKAVSHQVGYSPCLLLHSSPTCFYIMIVGIPSRHRHAIPPPSTAIVTPS